MRRAQNKKNGKKLLDGTIDGTLRGSAAVSNLTNFVQKITPKMLEECGIQKRFFNVTFENIERKGLPQDIEIRQNFGKIKEYALHIDQHIENGEGLILLGACGTLKTTMAIAVLRSQIDRGKAGFFIPMCSLIDDISTRYNANREDWARFEMKIRRTPLLILDDLGSENNAANWVAAKVDSIITERYNRMLPMIITTNHTYAELKNTYAARIIDRLRSTSLGLTFIGKSQRKTFGT